MQKSIIAIALILLLTSFKADKEFASPDGIFEKINELRRENNLPELHYLKLRQIEVNQKAKDLEEDYRHSLDRYQTENIAISYSYDGLFEAWKNSPPHKRNFLNKHSKYCTIGVYKGIWKGQEAYFGVYRGYTEKLRAR